MKKSTSIAIYCLLLCTAVMAGAFVYQASQSDFVTLDGTSHKHADYLGKHVIVNYFAEWCAPCLKEVPELSEFNRIKGDDAVLFAVSYDNLSDEELRELKQKYNMEFPLIASLNTPFPFERPQYLPATYIINPDGTLKGQLFGEQSAQALIEAIEHNRP
ncbi:TlpA family protein disulfide reductase [Ningiella sp. W23]|uniref:TlpA family protein disulfide reductase n=1 Tax=Ningiella sp. W23 TaxID=3023715 RepID=UPI0037575174